MTTSLPRHQYLQICDTIKSCKLAYSKYKIALEQKKENTKASQNERKPKLKTGEIVEVKKQGDSIALCIETLDKNIVEYCFEAEQKSDMNILIKANSLTKTVKEKKNLKNNLEKAIENLEKQYKSIVQQI